MREMKGATGHVLGGWQVSGFLTAQSGSPFSPPAGIPTFFPVSGLLGVSINDGWRSTTL